MHRKYPSFEEKSTIALCTIGWGYTVTNDRKKKKKKKNRGE